MGVAPETLEPERVAVLRGRTLDSDGAPLPDVEVEVYDHPEFGLTHTGTDGVFALVVNGGGSMVLRFNSPGFIPVDRTVTPVWQNYTWVTDAVMTPYDPVATTIDFSESMAAAQGSMVVDDDGARQATVLFAGTNAATMRLPDGSLQPLPVLAVRATELTTGPAGPAAMPGDLPATSAYTYAVELSIDEAVAADAVEVRFDEPVPIYVENFLDLPVGWGVPTAYYDRERCGWRPGDDGRVVEVLDVIDGLALLDVDGDGVPETPEALSAIGISDAELGRLATLYSPGQTLWHARLPHFSPWDLNWPYTIPGDATQSTGEALLTDKPVDEPCLKFGSVIECQNQVLGERLELTGVPFSLHYNSERVAGRLPTMTIPVTEETIPASLKYIALEVLVAGRRFTERIEPIPALSRTFVWDGNDAFGRHLQGAQPVTVRTGFVYDAAYSQPARIQQSFGMYPSGTLSGDRTRQEVTLWRERRETIGHLDSISQGLGGWTLSVHHAYDPAAEVLYLGDGTRRSAKSVGPVIRTVAGSDYKGNTGDGGPATAARLNTPSGLAVDGQGNLYIADTLNHRIRKVDTSGVISTIAGTSAGSYGEGVPAKSAQLNSPREVAVDRDGTLYVADTGNYRVRKITPDGIITTVAGTGSAGSGGDGGPATEAQLYPFALALDGAGNLLVADSSGNRVRRINANGIITTLAGTGANSNAGDGGPATAAGLFSPYGVAVDSYGNVFVSQGQSHRIRRIGPDGIITTIAGTGKAGYSGDGGAASSAQLNYPSGLAIDSEDNLYIADRFNSRVRRIDANGIITTLAGTNSYGFAGDTGPSAAARLNYPDDVAVGPLGRIYLADSTNNRIRVSSIAFPAFSDSSITLVSTDGLDLYEFDSMGRHLQTVNALTGSTQYRFEYDEGGLLVAIEDMDGNVTHIARDANGAPLTIIAPFGQRTELGMDAAGYLASVSDPAGEEVSLEYQPTGLLARLWDRRGGLHTFAYDAAGRLIRDEEPDGGYSALEATESSALLQVSLTTAEGRRSSYQVERGSDGSTRFSNTAPDGSSSQSSEWIDGHRTHVAPDGSTTTVTLGPDPRWGMQAPLETERRITTPGGLTQVVQHSRTARLVDPSVLSSLVSLTDLTSINGRAWSEVYDVASRTRTVTSPEGRTSTWQLDDAGRVLQWTPPGLDAVSFAYDAQGRIDAISRGDQVTTYSYYETAGDDNGLLEEMAAAEGRRTVYGYDPVGRTTSYSTPDDSGGLNETVVGYDPGDNMTLLEPPGGLPHRFTYTPTDQVASYVAPAVGQIATEVTYEYDLDRMLSGIGRPDGQSVRYHYDAKTGHLATIELPDRDIALSYVTGTGQPGTIRSPDATMTLSYDGPMVKRVAWTGALTSGITHTFDSDFRIASEQVDGASDVSYGYDRDGLLTRAGDLTITRDLKNGLPTASLLSGVAESMAYDGLGEPSSYLAKFGETELLSFAYARDRLGRISSTTERLSGQETTWSYTYGSSGRLLEVDRDGLLYTAYAYDSNGNRIGYSGPDGDVLSTEVSYDAQDRLERFGALEFTYTPNGDLETKLDTARGEKTHYVYDTLGDLVQVVLADGTAIEYLIDGMGRRIGRRVGGKLDRLWVYGTGPSPIAELDAQQQLVSRFVYGNRATVPEYLIRGGRTCRIVTDHLGSPRLVVDVASGQVVQEMLYDPFGRVLKDSNPGFQPFGFAGGLYDPATSLVRFGARDYDAESGRWTAKDPILFDGKDANLYGYVLSDPINHVDPAGLLYLDLNLTAGDWFGVVVGGLVTPEGFYPYVGLGFISPGASLSFAISPSNVSGNSISIQLGAQANGLNVAGGIDSTGGCFIEAGGSIGSTNILPQLSAIGYYTFPLRPW